MVHGIFYKTLTEYIEMMKVLSIDNKSNLVRNESIIEKIIRYYEKFLDIVRK